MRTPALALILMGLAMADVWADPPALVLLQSPRYEGLALRLIDSPTYRVELQRDGWMQMYNPDQMPSGTKSRRIDPRSPVSFSPLAVADLRQELQNEFGRDYEIRTTKNFVVVQPAGRGEQWPRTMERLHADFMRYMNLRRVQTRQGSFPMVAVVTADRPAMYAELKKCGVSAKRVAGVYDPLSNRMIMHDDGRADQIAATVRHEAAHQSAFNSNVHSRIADTPRYISEGLAQLFETPALVGSQPGVGRRQRIKPNALRSLRASLQTRGRFDAKKIAAILQVLVESERGFDALGSREMAYDLSWALMFYLSEQRIDAFSNLLVTTRSNPIFQQVSPRKRLADFEDAVQADVDAFALQLARFLDRLASP